MQFLATTQQWVATLISTHRQIPRNQDSRYLVVGDVHGRFESLGELLKEAEYDTRQDILLSVGDLIDRGPRSAETVTFFAAPGRQAIRGNHEQMVLDPWNWRAVWDDLHNGGPATCQSLLEADRDIAWLAEEIREYPVCLDVGDDDDSKAFRLVHAEQPFDWSEKQFKTFLETSTFLEAGEGRLLWGRADVTAVAASAAPRRHAQRSTRRCFCGHTPVRRITEAHDTHWIDTFATGTLTCIDAVTLESWSVPVREDEMPE